MAGLPKLGELIEALQSLLSRLPFAAAKKPRVGRAEEPFESLEDPSPDSDQSFEPNALPDKGPRARVSVDFAGIGRRLVGNRLVLGLVAAILIFALAAALTALIADAAPSPRREASPPITETGRAAASRFVLPPDPALDLSPPVTREAHFPYTDEDMKRFAPAHDPDSLAKLKLANDKAIEALFGTVK